MLIFKYIGLMKRLKLYLLLLLAPFFPSCEKYMEVELNNQISIDEVFDKRSTNGSLSGTSLWIFFRMKDSPLEMKVEVYRVVMKLLFPGQIWIIRQ